MKYLVVNSFHIYLFAPHINHVDHLRQVAGPTDRCTGAGFVSKDWKCYGESVGLGVGVGPIDNALLKIAMRQAPESA